MSNVIMTLIFFVPLRAGHHAMTNIRSKIKAKKCRAVQMCKAVNRRTDMADFIANAVGKHGIVLEVVILLSV